MRFGNRVTAAVAFLAVVAGCSTIERAREAQDSVKGLSIDDVPSAARANPVFSAMSLEELVGYAMTNRPSMASAALAVDSARLALKEIDADAPLIGSKPWLSPHVSASGSYSEKTPGQRSKDFRFSTDRGSPSASLSISVLVYDFGRHSARARAQAHRVLSAELDLAKTGYSVFGEVGEAYFNLLERRSLVEVELTNRVECAEHLERARERLSSGEAKQLDVLRARLDLARAEESLIAASNSLAVARANFVKALGADAVGGSADEADLPENPISSVRRGFADTSFTFAEAYAFARTNAPAMRIARAKLRAAAADVDYAIANLMPSVSATGSLSWVDPLWTWSWGVSVVQSVFEGFRKTTAVDRAVVAMRQAAEDVAAAEQALARDLEVAIAARDNARESCRSARESYAAARENLAIARSQYDIGEASRVDFTEAVSDYVEAMVARISAFYVGQRAEAALFGLTGTYPSYDEKTFTEDME